MRAVRYIIVCSLIFLLFPGSGFGQDESGHKREQLDNLQQQIQLLQRTLDQLVDKKSSVRAELRENERLYGTVAAALKRLNDQIEGQEKSLRKLRNERDLNQKKSLQLKQSLARQIRAAHAMGRQERLQLILNQQEPVKLERLWTYYSYVARARVDDLNELRATLERLQTSEQELTAAGERLIELKKEKQTEAASLAQSSQERQVLLAKLDREAQEQGSELDRLKQDERRLQNLILAVQNAAKDVQFQPRSNKSFANSRGRLQWPVKGKLVQDFGVATASSQSNGVLIRASEGDPVHAVADGQVIFADWLVRYGLLMIVDHGKGFMTLYAFNQSLYKSVGDTVKSGEQIAAVGRSGGRPIPALYFEVRENGRPINPMHWCIKVHNGKVG
jgi:murein hydrolase activator